MAAPPDAHNPALLSACKARATSSSLTKSGTCSAWTPCCPRSEAFPFDFGFVRSTKGDDGDPPDVLFATVAVRASPSSKSAVRPLALRPDPLTIVHGLLGW